MEYAVIGAYALILILGTLVFMAWVEVKALQKSTHQVQFVKAGEYEALTEELKEKLQRDPFEPI